MDSGSFSSQSSTDTNNRPFNEILLAELDAKLNNSDIHDIMAKYALSADRLQKEDLKHEDERVRLPNIGGIGDIDSAFEILPRDIKFLQSLFRDDYAQNAEEDGGKKHTSNLLLDSSSPFFDFLREIDSRSPIDKSLVQNQTETQRYIPRFQGQSKLLNLIKSQLSVVVNTDAQIDEPETASAMEVIDLPIKTEGTIEKKSAASDDFQVRQQRRKSKKSAMEGDADTPLEELPPPIKKPKRKYVWRTPRIDKKTGEVIGGPGAPRASTASPTAHLPDSSHVPQIPSIDESIEKLLSSVSCMESYWLSRIKDVSKRAAIASGSMGSGGAVGGSHAQPAEVVHAVSMELEKRGLPVLRHSNKLEAVELCIKRRKNIQYIGASDLGSTLSVSRVATTVANEYLSSYFDSAESFNLLLLTAKKDATDRCRKKWEALCNNNKKTNLEDIPPFMDRIPNPFDRCHNISEVLLLFCEVLSFKFGPNADAWHWLGHPSPTSVAIPGFHTRQPDDVFSFLRDSFPSLNHSGRAVVNNETSRILVEESDQMLTSLKRYATAVSDAAIHDSGYPSSGIWSLSSRAAIDRVLHTLAAFNSCIFVDRVSDPSDSEKGAPTDHNELEVDENELRRLRSVVHRAVLNAAIIYRMAHKTRKIKKEDKTEEQAIAAETVGGSAAAIPPTEPSAPASATKRKAQNDSLQEFWGPVLIVCDEKDFLAWEQGLRPLCSAVGLQILPYKGTIIERDQLLTYLNLHRVSPSPVGHVPLTVHVNLATSGNGSTLYTERGPCHVILMSAELFLSEHGVFQDILWELQIWDQPFGRFIHPRQAASLAATTTSSGKGSGKSKLTSGTKKLFQQHFLCYQLMLSMAGKAKAKIFSCDSLRCSSSTCSFEAWSRLSAAEDGSSSGNNREAHRRGDLGLLHAPDIVETLFAIFPAAMGLNKFYNNSNLSSGKATLVNTEAEHYLLSNSLFSLYGPGYGALDDNTIQELQKIATALTIICEDQLEDQLEHSLRVAQILDNPFGSSSQEVETELRKSYAQMYDILPHLEWVGLTISVELTGVSTLQHNQQVDLVVLDKNDCQEASLTWLPKIIASLAEADKCKVCFSGRDFKSSSATTTGPLEFSTSRAESQDNINDSMIIVKRESVPMEMDEIEEPYRDNNKDAVHRQQGKIQICHAETNAGPVVNNRTTSLSGSSGIGLETVQHLLSLGSVDLSPVNKSKTIAEAIHVGAESNEGRPSSPAVDELDERMVEGDPLEENNEILAFEAKVDPVTVRVPSPVVHEADMVSDDEDAAAIPAAIDSNNLAKKLNSAIQEARPVLEEYPVVEIVAVGSAATIDAWDSSQLKTKKVVPETAASDKEDNDLEDGDDEDGGAVHQAASLLQNAELAPAKKKRAKRRSKEEMDEARRQKLLRQEEKKAQSELKKKRKLVEEAEQAIVEKAAPIVVSEVEGAVANPSLPAKGPEELLLAAYEIERNKHLVKKIGMAGLHVWAVSIVFYGKSKFLGYFNSYEGAVRAYDTAHSIRTVMLSNVSSQAQVRFKGKVCRDIKLSDGSFISKDYYRDMEDEWLIEEIMIMCMPQVMGGFNLSSWANATCPPGANYPPAFAVLRGLNGFYARLTHFRCILGKASAGVEALISGTSGTNSYAIIEGNSVKRNFQSAELGDAEKGANGLVFDYGNEDEDEEDDEEDREDRDMCPSMHIGFHSSIARKHALIEWDFEQQIYSIQSLCPAGIWVNGVLKQTDDGPSALRHRSVVQIGCIIFFFLLPTLPINKSNLHPMAHNQNIANAMLQTLQYRSLICNYSTQQDNSDDLAESVVGEMADMLEKSDAMVLGGVFPGVDIALKDR